MPDLKKLITLEALQAALPSWLKSSSKPSYTADEISDTNTTNKFVTSTEKNTWNAKGTYSKPQNGIPKSDLESDVQTSLGKADTALQSFTETDPTVPSWAKATNKPSYNSDEISDTNRTHKFATQSQLNQIGVNQTNILYAAETGVKNVFPTSGGTTSHSDGTLFDKIPLHLNSGSWDFSWTSTALPVAGAVVAYDANKTEITRITPTQGSTSFAGTMTLSQDAYYITVYVGIDTTLSNIMCKPSWMSNDYQPYALPNSDLTGLQAEDRAELVELVDSGAKNKLQNKATSKTQNNVTFTVNADGEVTVSTTGAASANTTLSLTNAYIPNTFKGNIISGVPASTTSNTICMYIAYSSNGSSEAKAIYVNAATNPIHEILDYPYIQIFVFIYSGVTVSTALKFQPMICTKAAFGVSQKFVPYKATNYYLSDTQNCKTTYTLAPISVTSDPNRIIRVTARCVHSNSICRGIILSRNNLPSHYDNAANLVGRIEAEYDNRELNLSCIVPAGNVTIYMWTKFSADASNMVQLYVEYLT